MVSLAWPFHLHGQAATKAEAVTESPARNRPGQPLNPKKFRLIPSDPSKVARRRYCLERLPRCLVFRSMVGNRYKIWTQEDDRRLIELREAGRSTVSISAALRRSKSAVRGRISILRARANSTALQEAVLHPEGHDRA